MNTITADCITTARKTRDRKIFEDLFEAEKTAEKTAEKMFALRKTRRKNLLLGLSAEKSVFLPSETNFRG